MVCAGQAISRTTYAALFSLIGTTFGAGDGSTTFNLPDLRGRVVAAPDNMGGTQAFRLNNIITNAPGSVGGVQQYSLLVGELPGITSNVNVSVNVSGTSTRGDIGVGAFPQPAGSGGLPYTGPTTYTSVGFTGSGTGTGTAQSNNTNGSPHINVQPTMVLNKIIRVSFDG
jgi:microcystin-dependent protein